MSTANLCEQRWAREIARYIGVKSQFILWGNVNDVYPLQFEETVATLTLEPCLTGILKREGYKLILRYEPLFGFTIMEGSEEYFNRIIPEGLKQINTGTLLTIGETLEKLLQQKEIPTVVIVSFASRLLEAYPPQERNEFFYRTWRLMLNSTPFVNPAIDKTPRHNLLLWIVDKENDLPPWYSLNNPRAHTLSLQKPDHAMRRFIIDSCARQIPKYEDMAPERQTEKKSLFLDQTGGMFATEIMAISQIARKEKIPFEQIDEAIRRYKTGVIENPWAKISRHTYEQAFEALSARVIGQETAVAHSVDVLKRSLYNLSGSQFSRLSQKPKGVLFLAGPTGVGKTELAKSITEMIFGSPANYLRFDMSEYAHDHADQRLLGSPPGYVGYEVGGQLTNAVREKPFSLILFDEIEKGHPKILDIFLQILDDGRLTSGRGETAWFSESLIVFTSNLGIYSRDPNGNRSPVVTQDMDYPEIQAKILNSIQNYFKFEINRPEILNRIGNNIVVFDFIRPAAAEKIFEKMLGNILYKLADTHKIDLKFSQEAREKLQNLTCADLSMGGRGIGNALEEYFVNPLGRALFEIQAEAGSYMVKDVKNKGALVELEIIRL